MKPPKIKANEIKVRNWHVVAALGRKRGPMQDRKRYSRKRKHKLRDD